MNPRLALVWATTDTITTKLLYGSAFRAPTIAELFVTSNPMALGNPDLQPEKIDTYEFAFSHQLDPTLRYSANLYLFRIKDFISYALDAPSGVQQAQNTGKIDGKGVEFELEYAPFNTVKLLANYVYQEAEDDESKQDAGEAPNHQVYARSQWEFRPEWLLTAQVNWIGRQARVSGDTRSKVDDYATLDVVLRKANLLPNMNVMMTMKNVMDEDVREPSPGATYPFPAPYVPNDFPLAGRSLYGEVSYAF